LCCVRSSDVGNRLAEWPTDSFKADDVGHYTLDIFNGKILANSVPRVAGQKVAMNFDFSGGRDWKLLRNYSSEAALYSAEASTTIGLKNKFEKLIAGYSLDAESDDWAIDGDRIPDDVVGRVAAKPGSAGSANAANAPPPPRGLGKAKAAPKAGQAQPLVPAGAAAEVGAVELAADIAELEDLEEDAQ
jgi:hypothetical protein